ncbi:MAG: hypothetical protein IPG86_16210 [Chitinophagaceae bacterium]|nr:hypothetical protein [Chitinophagaceae bacterium]
MYLIKKFVIFTIIISAVVGCKESKGPHQQDPKSPSDLIEAAMDAVGKKD